MSDRLTDAALAELEDIAFLRLSKADQEAGMRLDGRAAIAVRDQAAKRYLVNLVIEVRERRAADLTAEDVEALEFARGLLRSMRFQVDYSMKQHANALAALDKLIAGASR